MGTRKIGYYSLMAAASERLDALRSRSRRNHPPAAAGWAPSSLDLRFSHGDLARVRTLVAGFAAASGIGPRLDDVVLMAHELCANVIQHGGGDGRLWMWRDGHHLMCRVSDSGPGMADTARVGTELPASRSSSGRGLWLAKRVAAVQIATGPTGTTVTADVTLDA